MKNNKLHISVREKDSEEWLSILKEKAGSYSGDKPDMSWDELKSRMLAAGYTVKRNRRRFMTAAVAACLAAFVAGGLFLTMKQKPACQADDNISKTADSTASAKTLTADSVSSTSTDTNVKSEVADGTYQACSISSDKHCSTVNQLPADTVTVAATSVSQTDKPCGQSQADGQNDKISAAPEYSTAAADSKSAGRSAAAGVRKQHSPGGKFSIGINGQFGNNGGSRHHAIPVLQSSSREGDISYMTFAMSVARTEYHYAAPVSFGASVRYDMPSGLFLESGLRFTQYLTMVTPSGARQMLIYAGVPVGIGFNLFDKGNLGIYASGYYMPALCIGGRESVNYPTNHTSRNDIPPQHSFGISAGADYTVWSRISLYAEPTLAYYLPNDTAPVTLFKEHPLYFTLNLGARFNF